MTTEPQKATVADLTASTAAVSLSQPADSVSPSPAPSSANYVPGTAESAAAAGGQVVTPWDVQGEVVDGQAQAINYDKLIQQFGTRPVDAELIERFQRVIGKPLHRFIRRGIVFSHRDLSKILDLKEAGKPFYLYTGRGPSSNAMHLGHMVPFTFVKYLQDVFDVPLVIQLTDDEKFLFRQGLSIEDVRQFSRTNARQIIALGFKPEKTFIFSNLDYVGTMYPTIVKVSKHINFSTARAVFGFDNSDSLGKIHFASIQAAPSFSAAFPTIFGGRTNIPCLIPCSIDQDPYFRVTRDVAAKLKYHKPSLIHSTFLPALQGSQTKMSASSADTSIYMSDTPNQIKNKINRYAFSGGQVSLEEHRRLGGNPDVDVPYQYLTYFLEDDEELKALHDGYKSGVISTGEMKQKCIKVIQDFVKVFQDNENAVTDDIIDKFMDKDYPRPVDFGPSASESKNKK
ncbi:putative tryptophan--tRNA ligase [Ramicandelaber brevisporus]|nr:putative tryptophan--tRNA ligase [Ramicandelaber brevisporus]KAI8868020.1 putative tryptophan--tRNA ligase [Ramicandelaber brevisporus]